MNSVNYDIAYLQEGFSELQAYLLSPAMQRPLITPHQYARSPFPPLTSEFLLYTRQCLREQQVSQEQSKLLDALEEQYQTIIGQWYSAWISKCARGFHHRIVLWQNYLNDLNQDFDSNHDRYPTEIRSRVMLALLSPYASDVSNQDSSLLQNLDRQLRAIFKAGTFIWDNNLQSAFPAQIFWYLYGRPASTKRQVHNENFDR